MKEERSDLFSERSQELVGEWFSWVQFFIPSQIRDVLVNLPFIQPEEVAPCCRSKSETVKLLCSKHESILQAIRSEKVGLDACRFWTIQECRRQVRPGQDLSCFAVGLSSQTSESMRWQRQREMRLRSHTDADSQSKRCGPRSTPTLPMLIIVCKKCIKSSVPKESSTFSIHVRFTQPFLSFSYLLTYLPVNDARMICKTYQSKQEKQVWRRAP
eukprot:751263-Hanusia_phi.AAC.1